MLIRWVPVSRIHRASFVIACMDSVNVFMWNIIPHRHKASFITHIINIYKMVQEKMPTATPTPEGVGLLWRSLTRSRCE